MAHGDTYEHVKRWLKQRFTFVDTLFDYAPSYNNDVLTIRANTTELMTLEIETYTPVYQHVSWYNGQMDKKKIDGKVSVEFSGTAQAATDQEVLIYGGSNVKSIKGITSMNPNRMLIGSATKLVEIDAHDCPLLADINANKANLSPHEYLNKVNLSNCPLLEGNLRLNNSPLVQEINIKGTNITGMNLPSSIRNLQILRLPNTMTELTLNDAGMLHTLEFDEGVALQSISMTNCNALTNVVNFDLLQTPSITLNNSYNNVAELYFRDTTNLALSNMSNLERVIFTPNSEYETFELINVANAPDYKVTTFNCPKLSTFMTTAPYRESFNDCGMKDKELVEYIDSEIQLDVIQGYEIITTGATAGDLYQAGGVATDFIEVKSGATYTVTTGTTGSSETVIAQYDENKKYIKTSKGVYEHTATVTANTCYIRISSRYPLYVQLNGLLPNSYTIQVKDYGDIQPNTTFTANSIDISNTQFTDVKLLCTTDTNTLKLPTTVKNFYCDSSFDLDTNYLEDGEYDVVHGELVEPYTTDYEGEVVLTKTQVFKNYKLTMHDNTQYHPDNGGVLNNNARMVSDKVLVQPGTVLRVYINGVERTGSGLRVGFWKEDNTDVHEGTWYGGVVREGTYYIRVDIVKEFFPEATVDNITIDFTGTAIVTPNLIPSSADGSLIFSMYAPSNTVAPASGTWDLHGLEFDNFHTFGMNNDVKLNEVIESIPNTDNLYCKVGEKQGATDSNYNSVGWFDLSSFSECTVVTSDGSDIYRRWCIDVNGAYSTNTVSSGGRIEDLCSLSFSKSVTWFELICDGVPYRYDISSIQKASLPSPKTAHIPSLKEVNRYLESISMPARYDDYNITIKNAYIKPTTHNTMLYPLLVNEDNPITGTLDYTNYAGKHLSWSFAYTDEEYVNIIQPKDELLNSYEYKYNAFYDTEYEFENPYEIARYTSSASGVLPGFNAEFTYTYDEINNGDGTYTTKIYADSLDNLPTKISFTSKPNLLTVDKLNTSKVTTMFQMFRSCENLTRINCRLDTSSVKDDISQMFLGCSNLEYVDATNLVGSNIKYASSLFSGCTLLNQIDGLDTWDTSNVTDMADMFRNCGKLTSLDLSGIDTSNVTNMQSMFYNCSRLTSLDLSELDTGKVTDMTYMFYNCSGLTSLDLSGFNTSNVTNMYQMFSSCSGLTSLDVSGFDTSNVTNMQSMFFVCKSLTSLDLSNFDTSKVTNMASTFSGCSKLTSLDVSGFDTSNVTDMNNMFQNCSSLTSLDVSNFDTSKVTRMDGMFNGCYNLTSLDVSGFDTSNVTNMSGMFYNCWSLKEVKGIENWDCSKVAKFGSMFQGATVFGGVLDLRNWKVGQNATVTEIFGFMNRCANLKSVDMSGWVLPDNINLTNFMSNQGSLHTVRVIGWSATNIQNICGVIGTYVGGTIYGDVIIDETYLRNDWVYDNVLEIARYTANATGVLPSFNADFTYTYDEMDNGDGTYTTKVYADDLDNLPTSFSFYTKSALLSVERMNVSKVTSAQGMFYQCSNVTYINSSNWNTSSMTAMNSMFNGCSNLTSLDVSGFDTKNVLYMNEMFSDCKSLTSIDLSGFDTGNVTIMHGMFYGCSGLTSLDLSGFDTSEVTTMQSMFYNCSQLTSLDVSGLDTSKVTNMSYMFSGCSGLTSLHVESWSLDNVNTIIPQLSASPSTSTLYGTVVIDESTLPRGWVYKFDDINVFLKFTASINSNNLATFNTSFTEYDVSVISLENNLYQYTYQYTGSGRPTIIRFFPSKGTSYAGKIKSIEKLVLTNASTMFRMFSGCSGLTSIDLSRVSIGSSGVSMSEMFYNCSRLTSLDLSGLDKSKVTNMNSMFYGCNKLTSIDLSGIDTSNVTDMASMFYNCSGLTSLNLSGFDTSNVTNMYQMFSSCSGLTSLDVSRFNTSNVTNMQSMFYNCGQLTSLDVSGFDTSNVTNMQSMFSSCSNLTSLNVSRFNTSKVTNMQSMFSSCSGLTSLDLSELDTGKVTNMSYMFSGCKGVTDLDLSSFDTTNVTNMTSMFESAEITNLTINNWNVSKVTTMVSMFDGLKSSTVSITNWTETTTLNNMQKMFSFSTIGTLVGFENLNTSKVTNMKQLFWASNFTSLDFIEGWDTSSLTSTYEIFRNCDTITSLDLSNWDWSLCTSASNNNAQFMYCSELVHLKLPKNVQCSIDLSYTKLDVDSLLDVINNLATVTTTQTLTLGSTLLAKLSEEQIAIAVNKGWTVV